MLSIVIMAAGASQRFGGCKLLAKVNAQPLLEHGIRKAKNLLAEQGTLQVITGAWHSQIETAMQNGELTQTPLLFNSDWEKGLGNSIAFAIRHLPESIEKVLILLADQIAITTEELQQLINGSQDSDITCAHYAGKRGVPAIFSRSQFKKLVKLNGEQGAKALLHGSDITVKTVIMESAGLDIDTKQQLERIETGVSYSGLNRMSVR